MKNINKYQITYQNRRKFLRNSALGLGTLSMGMGFYGCTADSNKTDTSTTNTVSEAPTKLGVALVGLGSYAEHQLGPALLETNNCYLAGIVTGTKEKEAIWQEKYGFPEKNIYNYDNFDEIANNDDIDIIYVVLPNSMHAEYTIRAADAGKHVISEKPMATSVEDAQKMIDACQKAGVKLSVGYRLHFDPYNLEMVRLCQEEIYGPMKNIEAGFAFQMGDPNRWRMKKDMAGGGPLMDVGIYAMQGAMYMLDEIPVSLSARDLTIKKDFFTEVEGTLEWEMNFPSGLTAFCKTSYEDQYDYLRGNAAEGTFEISPAYIYNGLKGYTPDGPISFDKMNQQAAQMDAFAKCILENTDSIVPGEMGLRDMYIIEQIYASAAQGGKEMELSRLAELV